MSGLSLDKLFITCFFTLNSYIISIKGRKMHIYADFRVSAPDTLTKEEAEQNAQGNYGG